MQQDSPLISQNEIPDYTDEEQGPGPKYKITQQALNDFDATITAKPDLTREEIFKKFPEFNNDEKLLQSALDYSATSRSGKYGTLEELNSKFPEFEFTTAPKPEPEPVSEFKGKNPIDLIKQSNELSGKKKIISTPAGAGGFGLYAPTTIQVNDEDAQKKADQINDIIKQQGYDPKQINRLFGDIPEDWYGMRNFSKDILLQGLKDNPQGTERFIAATKYQNVLLNYLSEKQKENPGLDLRADENTLLNSGKAANYNDKRIDNSYLVQLTRNSSLPEDQKEKIISNIATDKSFSYGQAAAQPDLFKNDPLSKFLNSNQIAAFQYLKDIYPEKADGFAAAFINPETIKNNDEANIGREEKLQKLEEIGIGLKINAATEQLNSISKEYENLLNLSRERPLTPEELTRSKELESKGIKLSDTITQGHEENAALSTKYPNAAYFDADSFAQELLGQEHGFLSHMGLTAGKATSNTVNGLINFIKEPFRSDEQKYISQLEILGGEKYNQQSTYLTQPNQIDQSFTPKVSPQLQADIESIKNNKLLSNDEKRKEVTSLLMMRSGEWQRNPIEGGKTNLGIASLAYGVGDLAANLAPFIAAEALTGGGATAGYTRKFASLFASAAATSFQETYARAIEEGVSDPFSYATRVTAINSLAMAVSDAPGAIKKLAGMQKTPIGDMISKLSDDEILTALRSEPKALSTLRKAYNIGSKIGNAALESGKLNAKIVGLTTGAQVVNDLIDGKVQNIEDYAKQAGLELLKGTIAFSIPGLIGESKMPEINKAALFEAGRNPIAFREALEQKINNGTIAPAEAKEIKDNIDKASDVFKRVPFIDAAGKPLTDQGRRELMFLKMQEHDIENHLTKDLPKDLQEIMQERLIETQDKIDKVYKGSFLDDISQNKVRPTEKKNVSDVDTKKINTLSKEKPIDANENSEILTPPENQKVAYDIQKTAEELKKLSPEKIDKLHREFIGTPIEEITNDANIIKQIEDHDTAIKTVGTDVILDKDINREGHPDLIKGFRVKIAKPENNGMVVIEYRDHKNNERTATVNKFDVEPIRGMKPNKESPFSSTQTIAEAYHKAKAEGTNPELIKDVESAIEKLNIQTRGEERYFHLEAMRQATTGAERAHYEAKAIEAYEKLNPDAGFTDRHLEFAKNNIFKKYSEGTADDKLAKYAQEHNEKYESPKLNKAEESLANRSFSNMEAKAIIEKGGLTLENVDLYKHLFTDSGFPFSKEDYTNVLEYLNKVKKYDNDTRPFVTKSTTNESETIGNDGNKKASDNSQAIESSKIKNSREIEVFNSKVDSIADKILDILSPKHLRDSDKLGATAETIVRGAAEIIKAAYKTGKTISDAVEEAIKHIRENWNDKWGKLDEDTLRSAFTEGLQKEIDQSFRKPQSGKELQLSKEKFRKASSHQVKHETGLIERTWKNFKNLSYWLDNPNRYITALQHNIESHYRTETGNKIPLGRQLEQNAIGNSIVNARDYITSVLKGLNKKDIAEFHDYIFAKRIIDRNEQQIHNEIFNPTAENKSTGNLTLQDGVNVLADMKRRLGDSKMQDFKNRSDKFQEAMDLSLQRLVNSGMLSKDAYKAIKTENDFYAPFNVVQQLARYDEGKAIPKIPASLVKKIKGIEFKDGIFSSEALQKTQEALNAGTISKEDFYNLAVPILENEYATGKISDIEYFKEFAKLSNPGFVIKDIFDKAAAIIFDTTRLAHKNELLNRIADLAKFDKEGIFIKKIDGHELRYTREGGTVSVPKRLHDIKVEEGFGAIGYKEKGVQKFLSIELKAANTLNRLDKTELTTWMKGLNAVNAIFRTSVITLSPSFQYANAVIDGLRFAAMSRYGALAGKSIGDGIANAVLFVPQYIEAVLHAGAANIFGKHSSLYIDFMKSAGYTRGLYDDPFLNKSRKIKTAPKSFYDHIKFGGIDKVFHFIEGIGTTLEQSHKLVSFERGMDIDAGIRLGVSRWKNYISQSKTPENIGLALDRIAYETQNFAGSPNFPATHGLMKTVSVIFQFFSARLKGEMTDYRRVAEIFGSKAEGLKMSKTERLQALMQFSAVITPIVLLSMNNHKDDESSDEFKTLTQYDRDNNMMIPFGKFEYENKDGIVSSHRDYVKIPLRGLTSTINVISNSFLQYSHTKDKEELYHAITASLGNVSPFNLQGDDSRELSESLISNTTPVFKSYLELSTNRNTYWHSNLIPESILKKYKAGKLKSFEVATKKTPQWAIDLSKILFNSAGIEITPITIDYLENTFSGNISESVKGNAISRRILRSEGNTPVNKDTN